MDKDEVVSHDECMLGKWMYGFAMDEYGQMPEMREMEKIHEQMHGVIKEIVTLKNSSRVADAESAYDAVGPMSEQVVHLLRQVEEKIEQ